MDEILTLIEAGNYVKDAVMACNIDEATYYRWMKKAEADHKAGTRSIYAELCKSAACARAKARTHHVGIILCNAERGKDARASIEFLARTDPENWARKDALISVNNQASVEIQASQLTDEEVEARARAILARRQ